VHLTRTLPRGKLTTHGFTVILYILGMLVLAFKAKKNGDSPWTRETHELQEKSW
jgi:hypothetical protein